MVSDPRPLFCDGIWRNGLYATSRQSANRRKNVRQKRAAYQVQDRGPRRTGLGRGSRGCGLLCYGEVRIDNPAGQRFPGLQAIVLWRGPHWQPGWAEIPGVAGYCVMERSALTTRLGRDSRGCGLLCYGEVRIDNPTGQRFPGLQAIVLWRGLHWQPDWAEIPRVAGYCVMERSALTTWLGRDSRGCRLLCYGEVRIDNPTGQRFPGLWRGPHWQPDWAEIPGAMERSALTTRLGRDSWGCGQMVLRHWCDAVSGESRYRQSAWYRVATRDRSSFWE